MTISRLFGKASGNKQKPGQRSSGSFGQHMPDSRADATLPPAQDEGPPSSAPKKMNRVREERKDRSKSKPPPFLQEVRVASEFTAEDPRPYPQANSCGFSSVSASESGRADIVFLSAFPQLSQWYSAEELRFQSYMDSGIIGEESQDSAASVAQGGGAGPMYQSLGGLAPDVVDQAAAKVVHHSFTPTDRHAGIINVRHNMPASSAAGLKACSSPIIGGAPRVENPSPRSAGHVDSLAGSGGAEDSDVTLLTDSRQRRPGALVELKETEDTVATWITEQLTSSKDFMMVSQPSWRPCRLHTVAHTSGQGSQAGGPLCVPGAERGDAGVPNRADLRRRGGTSQQPMSCSEYQILWFQCSWAMKPSCE